LLVFINDMNIKRIIKEEFENILSEGLSKILYHYTHISNLFSILKMNKFATSSNLGSVADAWKSGGKNFFFSTSRAKGMSGYGKNHGNVAIVLDGEKLNQKYKGSPVDYWNWSFKRSDYKSDNDYINALQSKELEDRIMTDKPYIDNAKDYILEIHILTKGYQDFVDKGEVQEILRLAGNIPVYFYDNDNDFKLQNKAKAIPPENLGVADKLERRSEEENLERSAYDAKWFFKKIAPAIIAKNDMNDGFNDERDAIEKILKQCAEEYKFANQYEELMSEINKKAESLGHGWGYIDDEYYVMQAEIHNHRGNPDKYFRELLKLLINDMRKWRVKNLRDYFVKKFNMYVPTR